MATAIGPVFDYLLGDGMKAALVAVADTVSVQDGWVTDNATDLVVIGAPDPNHSNSADDKQGWVSLEARLKQETFGVYCYIDCWRGGSDQAEARQAALDLFDAFAAYIAADPSLGGAVNGGAIIADISLGATQSDAEADQGRRALVLFTLRCTNVYR